VTMVVGYVPKPEGLAALHAAIDQARWRGEALYVVNVSSGQAISDPSLASAEDLAAIRVTLEESGVPYQLDQHIGDLGGAAYVLDSADRLDAVLIVIGIRHRTATGKLITGSDAQRILLAAECSVLAVKAPRAQSA